MDRRRSSDPRVAVAPTRPLAWEPPHDAGAVLKKKKKERKEKKELVKSTLYPTKKIWSQHTNWTLASNYPGIDNSFIRPPPANMTKPEQHETSEPDGPPSLYQKAGLQGRRCLLKCLQVPGEFLQWGKQTR